MTNLTLRDANIIQRALLNGDGLTQFNARRVTAELAANLTESGLTHTGCGPSHQEENYWSIWAVTDRDVAIAAIAPFRVVENPIEFTLTPFEQDSYWANYRCPCCGTENLKWTDGDSVSVPVLPEGIDDYEELDTVLMVGTCHNCNKSLFMYEFGFTTVADPVDHMVFCAVNIEQDPDEYQMFTAEAVNEKQLPWVVSRRWYRSGEDQGLLPKGPFMVDLHQFGPFELDHEGELTGPYGVANCGTSNEKWAIGEQLLKRLTKNAMAALRQASV